MVKRGTDTKDIVSSQIPSSKGVLRFPQFPDSCPDSILITDKNGDIYYVNPAWEKLTGYTLNEVIGKNPQFLQSKKTPKSVYKKLWSELSNGNAFSTDLIYEIRKDGTELKIHSSFFPIKKDDQILFYVQMHHDITEHAALEEALKEKEQLLEVIINSTDSYAILLLDRKGFVKTWNDRAQKQNGYSADEIINKHFSLFYPQKDRDEKRPDNILHIAAKDGRYEEVGLRVNKHGDKFWCLVVITAIRGKKGALKGFVKITRDITRERSTENKIKESEKKYRTLMERSSDAIVIHNMKRKIIEVNTRACELLGYSKKELLGKDGASFINYLQGEPNREAQSELKVGETVVLEREVIHKGGTTLLVEISSKRITKSIIQSIIRDITERKKIEKQKDAFIGIASHELKTPITTLSAYVQILEKRLGKDKKNAYFIQNIKSQTNRVVGLIDDLLNVSRIDSGKLGMHFRPLDLEQLVKKVIRDFQLTTDTHEIIKEGNITEKVLGDENRIEQVLINLLTNAIKYSPNAKKVIVHLSAGSEMATVSVEDFGLGIVKADQLHVFERFYRTSDKEEGKIAGFGLGLYIASEIIKRHKGIIWVESEKGKGSTFSFSLPLD